MPITGEICNRTGYYNFVRHVDGTIGCHRRSDEKVIEVSKGKKFPAVRTCKRPAIWIYVGKENQNGS